MIWEITTMFLALVYWVTILTTIIMLLMENRSPVKSIAWIIVLLVLPGVGWIFYLFFGKNFRKRLVISHRSLSKWKEKVEVVNDSPNFDKQALHDTHNLAFLSFNSCGSSLYVNNCEEIFLNGKDLYARMFPELLAAKKYIHLEYYVFNSDTIGSQLIEILEKKAREGVKVRVIIDDVGSWMMKKKVVNKMRECGIEIYCFLKVGLPFLSSKVNYRNHRKIVVIDGEVGYTGGMNVADRYVEGSKWGVWRDTHLRLEGDSVHGLQRVFISDWYFVSQVLLTGDALYYPVPEVQLGNSLVQIVSSGPDSQWMSIMQFFFMAIARANKYVYIETPYFLPNVPILNALQVASLGGADVRIILPRRSDAQFALLSSCSYLTEILKAGVKVYFYDPGFIHSKTIVIDDKISTVGSANMDFRSFEQNFEVNTMIYNVDFATKMKQIFFDDLKDSTQVELEEWKKRSIWRKFGESVARLFSPLM